MGWGENFRDNPTFYSSLRHQEHSHFSPFKIFYAKFVRIFASTFVLPRLFICICASTFVLPRLFICICASTFEHRVRLYFCVHICESVRLRLIVLVRICSSAFVRPHLCVLFCTSAFMPLRPHLRYFTSVFFGLYNRVWLIGLCVFVKTCFMKTWTVFRSNTKSVVVNAIYFKED